MSTRATGPASIHIFFFFNDTATTEIYPLSLHDALPISVKKLMMKSSSESVNAISSAPMMPGISSGNVTRLKATQGVAPRSSRSEEHTSELQSQSNLVCRLLLEKKKRIDLRPPSRDL